MDQLRETINTLGVDAKVLLLRAQHEGMKEHVRAAQRDLTEALSILDQRETSAASHLRLSVVAAAVKSASLRLRMVESALRTSGPHASEIN